MDLSFENKVALVTGAASGMGLATAQAFAEAGGAVVLSDFGEDAVRAEAQKLVAAGHKVIAVRCDVSDDGQVAGRTPMPLRNGFAGATWMALSNGSSAPA